MKFEQQDPKTIEKKWTILSDTIKAIRSTDSTRPIVVDSSAINEKALRGYEELVKPKGLMTATLTMFIVTMDGITGPFTILSMASLTNLYAWPPLISQEMSTGYPNNDDGHPVRFYPSKIMYTGAGGRRRLRECRSGNLFGQQAYMTKELTETLRRTSHEAAAGVLLFSYATWFQTPWLADDIKPSPTY